MAPFKLFMACTALATADQCVENCEASDQTALLQSHLSRKGELTTHHAAMLHFPSLGNLKDKKHRHASLAQFEETATSLLRDREAVTPAVTSLVTSIVDMLKGSTADLDTVNPTCNAGEDCGALGSILSEHDSDVNILNTEFNEFSTLSSEAAQLVTTANAHNDEVTVAGSRLNLHSVHTTCRQQEDAMCAVVGACMTEAGTLQTTVDQFEAQLVAIDTLIHTDWCVEATCPTDGSAAPAGCNDHGETGFRSDSRTLFIQYNDKLAQLTGAQTTLTNAQTICDANTTTWQQQRTQCDTAQTSFENAACQYEHSVEGEVGRIQSEWDAQLVDYGYIVGNLTLSVADRKVEWTTIRKVVCLLDELSNPNDAPAAGDSSYNEAAIAACHSMAVSTTHLDITHSDPAALTLPTTSGYDVTCSTAFTNANYAGLGQCSAAGGISYYFPGVIGNTNPPTAEAPDTIGAQDSTCVCVDPSA